MKRGAALWELRNLKSSLQRNAPTNADWIWPLQLHRARTEAGITQAELARRIGVSQQQIAKLEHPDGDLKISTLERAARALGLSLDINLVKDAA